MLNIADDDFYGIPNFTATNINILQNAGQVQVTVASGKITEVEAGGVECLLQDSRQRWMNEIQNPLLIPTR